MSSSKSKSKLTLCCLWTLRLHQVQSIRFRFSDVTNIYQKIHLPINHLRLRQYHSFTANQKLTNAHRISVPLLYVCRNNIASSTTQLCQSQRNVGKLIRVLGIETSCDDTGAAVVDGFGNILGEALNQQTQTHLKTGGIIPNVAKEMHADNIKCVVENALRNAGMDIMDVDGIAVTVKPGLAMSLRVGLAYAQKLAHVTSKLLIPIHHMEAHALTARMIHDIPFPFMVLLTSGGHCLLAVATGVEDFRLLGTTQDVAPGDAFDKTARELKLNTVPGLETVCGGAAVEMMAEGGDPHSFPPLHVMTRKANCHFSFTGIKISARTLIQSEYKRQDIPQTEVLPNAADVCAWFQYSVAYHLARRLQRAFIYTDMQGLIIDNKTLVMSGGVACNMYLRGCIEKVCDMYGYTLVCPPQHLCTDNGIMIAWNGVEKMLAVNDCFHDPYTLQVQARASFGEDISSRVTNTSIKLPKLRI